MKLLGEFAYKIEIYGGNAKVSLAENRCSFIHRGPIILHQTNKPNSSTQIATTLNEIFVAARSTILSKVAAHNGCHVKEAKSATDNRN